MSVWMDGDDKAGRAPWVSLNASDFHWFRPWPAMNPPIAKVSLAPLPRSIAAEAVSLEVIRRLQHSHPLTAAPVDQKVNSPLEAR